jgi:hypothetical protein
LQLELCDELFPGEPSRGRIFEDARCEIAKSLPVRSLPGLRRIMISDECAYASPRLQKAFPLEI